MKNRYVLKNNKRFLTFIFIIVLTILCTLLSVSAQGTKEEVRETLFVCKGDTLWSIASDHSRGVDVRKYIYEIKELNNLKDNLIYEGEELLLP